MHKLAAVLDIWRATHITSIHASQGTGRDCVILLGMTEGGLKRFSGETDNLMYNSLINVALSRQKRFLCVGLENNGDDIWRRFKSVNVDIRNEFGPIFTKLSRHTSLSDIANNCLENEKVFDNIKGNIIEKKINMKDILNRESYKNKNGKQIDWGHHMINNSIFKYYICRNICNNEKKHTFSDQLKATLSTISQKKIEILNYDKYLNYYLQYQTIIKMIKKMVI